MNRQPSPPARARRRTSARRALVLAVLAVVGLAVVPPAGTAADQVIGKPVLELSSPDNQFSPGESGTLQVHVSNEGSIQRAGPSEWVDRVTTARATTIEVMSGDTPIEVETGRYPVGSVPQGTEGPIPIEITVPEGTPEGTYELPVRVRYVYTRLVDFGGDTTEFSENTYDQVRTVTVQVTRSPRFEVVDRSTDALVGDDGTLTLRLRNVGSQPASDASVAVASRSDEVTFGTGSPRSEAFVGRWPRGETRTVNYSVRLSEDAAIREYTLNVSVSFEDPDGISGRSRTLQTSLQPVGEQAFRVEDVRSDVRVGEDGTVSGTVVNLGPGRAYSPVVELSIENPNIDLPESEYAVDDLGPDGRASFEFDVDVTESATSGSRQFAFVVRYRNAEGETRRSDELVARVPVEPGRDRFRVEPAGANLTAGGSGTISVRVTNAGEEPVTDVSAKLFASSPLSVTDDESFVSVLEPGASVELVFGLSAAGSALEKDYPVEMDFQYDDAEGDTVLSDTYRVPVTVRSPETDGPPMLPIAGGALLVAGVAGYLVLRRRRP